MNLQNMQPLLTIPLLILGAIAIFAVLRLGRKQQEKADGPLDWPLHIQPVLSKPEQILYHRLVGALPDYIVLAQVQVSRVLAVRKRTKNPISWVNRLNRMSYDFVVCSMDGGPLLAIELDDQSHRANHRIETDGKKDEATAAAKLQMVRWSVSEMPDATTIRKVVDAAQEANARYQLGA